MVKVHVTQFIPIFINMLGAHGYTGSTEYKHKQLPLSMYNELNEKMAEFGGWLDEICEDPNIGKYDHYFIFPSENHKLLCEIKYG